MQALEEPWPQDGRLAKSQQALAQHQQMAGKIAAVHRRDVERQQGAQGPGVVPVEEMTAMPLHGVHGAQGVGGPFDQFAGRNIAEVAGREAGQQGEPHIGGGGAVRHHRVRVLLKVVGRQPMILRADEGLEKGPGFSGRGIEEHRLRRRKPHFPAPERSADPPGNPGGGQPERKHNSRRQQRGRRDHDHGQGRDAGKNRGYPHGPIRVGQGVAFAPARPARRVPFKQPPPSDEQTPERAPDRIQAEPGLVREAGKGEGGLGQVQDC